MKNILAPLFAAVLCLSLLAGCSSKKPIVGKWQADGGKQSEFTADGKVTMSEGGMTINGTYTLPDDGHFTADMDLGGTKKSKTIAYTISGDTMNTDDGFKKDTYKRAK